MKKVEVPLLIAFILFTTSISSAGDVIYVDVNSPNEPGTGGFADPFRRIQDALNTAVEGDTVEIRPGLYTGMGNYDIDPNGKSITIRSSEPNNPDIQLIYNQLLDQQGKTQEALTLCNETRTLFPHNLYAHLRAAQILLDMNQIDEAMKITNQVISSHPQNAPAWLLRCNVHRMQGKMGKAIKDMEQCLTLYPDNMICYPAVMDGLVNHKEPAKWALWERVIDEYVRLTGRPVYVWQYACWPQDFTKAPIHAPNLVLRRSRILACPGWLARFCLSKGSTVRS